MFKFLLIFIFPLVSVLQAVVLIAPNEVGLRPGLSGEVKLSLNTQRGNTDKDESSARVIVGYDNNSTYVTWIDFSYSYGQSNNIENEDKAYAHYRFIHTFYRPDWIIEGYVQNQGDDFRKIQRRLLSGGGLRWRLFDEKYGRAYYGFGAYYEYMNYTDPIVDPQEYNARMNNYLAYTIKFAKASRFTVGGYFQPKFNDFKDQYTHVAAALKIHVYQKLFLTASLSYAYDTKPAVGVHYYDFQQVTSISWSFGAKSNR